MNITYYVFNSQGELLKRVHSFASLMWRDNQKGHWLWNGDIWYEYRLIKHGVSKEEGWYKNNKPPEECKASLLLVK